MSESRTLASERGIRAEVCRRKSEPYSEGRWVPRRSSKEDLVRRSRSNHARVSGRKSFITGSGESFFSFQVWPTLKQERRIGDEGPDHKKAGQTEFQWLVGEEKTSQRGEVVWGGREAAGYGATGRSMKAFQFGNVVKSKKGNHSGDAYVSRGQKIALYKRGTPWRAP